MEEKVGGRQLLRKEKAMSKSTANDSVGTCSPPPLLSSPSTVKYAPIVKLCLRS